MNSAPLSSTDWHRVSIDRIADGTGILSVLEVGKHIPFDIKRVFWVGQVTEPNVERGAHAHQALQQVIFSIVGSCKIDIETKDGRTRTLTLSEGNDGLFLNGPVWRTMRLFTSDCCLMVLCDRIYAEDRVIRDYQEFKKL